MIELLFVGNSSINEIHCKSGEKLVAGGSALGSAITASYFQENNVAIYTSIGKDFPIEETLDKTSISTEFLYRVSCKSNRFVIDEDNNTIKLVTEKYIPFLPLNKNIQSKHLHVSCRAGVTAEYYFNNIQYETSSMDVMFSSLSTKKESLLNCLPLLNFFLCNDLEYRQIINKLNIIIHKKFPKLMVLVTNKERGVTVFHKEEIIEIPGICVPDKDIISTTSAGDSFTGAFLGAYNKGHNIFECIYYALAISATSIEDFGVKHVLLKKQLIEERYTLLSNRKNKINKDIFINGIT